MQLWPVFLTTAVFLFLLMPQEFQCILPCRKTFAKQASLHKHKRTCTHYAASTRHSKALLSGIHEANVVPRRYTALLSETPRSMTVPYVPPSVPVIPVTVPSEQTVPIPSSSEPEFTPDPATTEPMDEEMTVQQLTQAGRPRRNYRVPARFVDAPPEPLAPIDELPESPASATSRLPRVLLIVRDRLITTANSFGLWRDYPRRPTFDPSGVVSLEELAASHLTQAGPASLSNSTAQTASHFKQPSYWPFANVSIARALAWLHSGSTLKSEAEVTSFVRTVIQQPDFKPEHFSDFDAHRENARLDQAIRDADIKDKFNESSVDILVPSGSADIPPQPFTVQGLLHRSLTAVIVNAFQDPLSHHLHTSPFKLFHRSSVTGKEQRIHGELYTSDSFLEEHDRLQKYGKVPPSDPDCKREKVLVPLMCASDGTHLANFGTAKAWPIYIMLGNMSKYTRALPNCGALYNLAYIPSLPDSFHDFASKFHQKWRTQKTDILAHCKRELMHAVWSKILDDEFIEAYHYGVVVMCSDGVERRIYPRIFTYSADYPEKVLLATMRDKGLCPCPRCLIPKSALDKMGMPRDMQRRFSWIRYFIVDKVMIARDAIYQLAFSIRSRVVEDLLKSFSGVPTMNAFFERLGPDVNPSQMLVPDFLHEFELGVWKALFTHLMRLLHAASREANCDLLAQLDERYRSISTFGHGTIRKFAANSSEMKKLAARDFEDLLQCSIPVFEGLLDSPHNRRILKLLYRTAELHALLKLRLHTDETLEVTDRLVKEFGKLMRDFRDTTCQAFDTVELPKETERRQRQQAASGPVPVTATSVGLDRRTTRKKQLNIGTVKFHFLGDYTYHIRRYGTTDSYSTQMAECAHRPIKKAYALTNKRDAVRQIAKKQDRMRFLPTAEEKLEEVEAAQPENLSKHHIISHSRKHTINLYSFVQDGDPSKKNFIPKLQDHLLGRVLGLEFDGDDPGVFSHEDRNSIRIRNQTMYRHCTARINYTTYDIRRDYDTINPRTHPFVMVASPEVRTDPNAHPFWYAQVLGVFHADVQHVGVHSKNFNLQTIEFLWVRWFGAEPGASIGHKVAKLPKIGFVPEDDDLAFGFLDPALVIRGCHLIPAFNEGQTNILLSTQDATEARKMGETSDWTNYYVGIFADRDMYMRFTGMGIGHAKNTCAMSASHENTHDDVDDTSGIIPDDGPEDEEVLENHQADDSDDGSDDDSELAPESDSSLDSDGDLGYDDL